jgi:hypothetical protein
MIYTAPFDMSVIGAGTMTILETGGGASSAAITLATAAGTDGDGNTSNRFWHYTTSGTGLRIYSESPTASLRHTSIVKDNLAYALQTAINTLWTPDIAIVFSNTTGKYTFSSASSFSITFDAAAELAGMPYLFGFTGDKTTATSHTSDFVCKYAIIPTLTATSVTGEQAQAINYEPGGIGNHPIADDGTGYGIARTTSPLYRDWVQQYESKARCMRFANGLTSAYLPAQYTPSIGYWTFQEMFEYCRGIWPFIVSDGFGESYAEAFSFRTDGMSWSPDRASPGNDTAFHIPFRTVVDGMVVAYSAA